MNRYEVNGEKRTSYDVLVDTVEFLESKNGTGRKFIQWEIIMKVSKELLTVNCSCRK